MASFYEYDAAKAYEKALASAQELIRTAPNLAQAHAMLGLVLGRLERFAESIGAFEASLRLNGASWTSWDNLGLSLMALNQVEKARDAFSQSLTLNPHGPTANWNSGLCLLLQGQLAKGFAYFPWRWQLGADGPAQEKFPLPAWDGSNITGKTLLVVDEQGFGDTLQFSRYLPMLRQRGMNPIFLVSAPLFSFFEGWNAAEIVARGSVIRAPIDAYAALPDLPRLLGTDLATIPAIPAYFSDTRDRRAHRWQDLRLRSEGKKIVGINWAGRATHRDDINRSCPLAALLPLLDAHRDIMFVSLQKPLGARDAAILRARDIPDFGTLFENFADAAAFYRQLDLIVTVDSAPAHLAGTIGTPAWIMLPFAPDWRWMLDRVDSPWYSSATLFRPKGWRDWTSVIAALSSALNLWKAGKAP